MTPLCTLLKDAAPGYPKNWISGEAATALGRIGDPRSLPTLEWAACQGIDGAIDAIGRRLGRAESFDILQKAARKAPKKCAYMTFAFEWLVRRSNKPFEPWMENSVWSRPIGEKRLTRWFAWWDANGEGFEIVRTYREAHAAYVEERRGGGGGGAKAGR